MLAVALAVAIAQRQAGVQPSWILSGQYSARQAAETVLRQCGLEVPLSMDVKLDATGWLVEWGSRRKAWLYGETGEMQLLILSPGNTSEPVVEDSIRIERAKSVALSFGMPTTAHLVSWNHDIRFEWLPEGHKFPAPIYGVYRVDQAGKLCGFTHTWKHVIETDKPVISLRTAAGKAKSVYRRHMKSIGDKPDPVNLDRSGLGYVSVGRSGHFRLAWIVAFDWRTVSIDAVNGACIGGLLLNKL